MKKILLFLLLIAAFKANAQSIQIGHDSSQRRRLSLSDTSISNRYFEIYHHHLKNTVSGSWGPSDTIHIYGDLEAAVVRLYKDLMESYDELRLANKILSAVSVNGEVTDRKPFDSAVKEYKHFKESKK